jgi:hypothetical protein
MILTAATIAAYKSFRKPVTVYCSDRTTILIGPNDHGKTNVLLAIQKLNPQQEFPRQEVNDRTKENGPSSVTFTLRLTEAERRTISDAVTPLQEKETATLAEQYTATAAAAGAAVGGSPPTETNMHTLTLQDLAGAGSLQSWWEKTEKSSEITFKRTPDGPLELTTNLRSETTRAGLLAILEPLLPKVFLFTPAVLRQLPDTVNLASLQENQVMQGVFHLAGIWEDREQLLSGNTRQNDDELREASKRLTTEVRKNWTQGKDLEFHLEYVNNDVRLSVKDTAKTVTAVADRSDGFTAYFAMRMLLVARTKQTTPNGYIFLFDEPGLNLHPKGQVDLQNVFEDIAQNNQIIYTTHSVFLINKNYPTRNHLVYKNEHGSNIDTKPFIGGWAKVKEHLGLYLSANFLFADKILLAEGPTDDIYLPSIIQGLISRGHFDGDLNALAIRAGLNSKDMLAVASTYISEERAVTVLVDGDIEGEQRKSRIEKWATSKKKKCPVLILSEYCKAPCAIENFLEPTLYTDAVIAASKHLTDDGTLATPAGEWQTELKKLLTTEDNHTLGKRAENATKTILGEAISDVLIAIKYAELLQKADEPKPTPEFLTNYWAGAELRRFANALWSTLGLPMRADTKAISLTT